jgi:hypothetical protein
MSFLRGGGKLSILSRYATAVALLLFNLGCVQAADFEVVATKKGPPALSLKGKIVKGDFEKLKSLIMKSPLSSILHLDSSGGDVGEAMQLGQLVRLLQISTMVSKDKVCASACFFVYLGGAGRLASGSVGGHATPLGFPLGYVGLHRPYLSTPSGSSESLERQATAMRRVRTYLEGYLVSNRLIDIMMSRPSNDIYWLSDDDLEELGDYPPELEELYISRCGYDRKIFKHILAAKNVGNVERTANLQERHRETNRCIAPLQYSAYEEGIAKLRAGWRPN